MLWARERRREGEKCPWKKQFETPDAAFSGNNSVYALGTLIMSLQFTINRTDGHVSVTVTIYKICFAAYLSFGVLGSV